MPNQLIIMDDKNQNTFFKKILNAALLVLLFCADPFFEHTVQASTAFNVTVFYPDVRKPYSMIFETITNGIKEHPDINLSVQRISKTMTEAEILKSLQQKKPNAVIMLGGGFKSLREKLNASFKTLYGATYFSSQYIEKGVMGVSMDPAPSLLFKELKKLHPNIKRIHVVFESNANGWLIEKAQQSTKKQGITLIPHQATNVKQAALIYKEIAQKNQHDESALWLLHHDPTLDSKSLLPRILVDAWKYKQVVISSNPAHVRQGALLSLLPDNQQIGKDLADMTINILNGKTVSIAPMKSSLVVANLRTAKHLSNFLMLKQKKNFALTYPKGVSYD